MESLGNIFEGCFWVVFMAAVGFVIILFLIVIAPDKLKAFNPTKATITWKGGYVEEWKCIEIYFPEYRGDRPMEFLLQRPDDEYMKFKLVFLAKEPGCFRSYMNNGFDAGCRNEGFHSLRQEIEFFLSDGSVAKICFS